MTSVTASPSETPAGSNYESVMTPLGMQPTGRWDLLHLLWKYRKAMAAKDVPIEAVQTSCALPRLKATSAAPVQDSANDRP
ncbi:MAG: hypothetical protein LBD77_01895 [Bifidobacteriaceae bacterium]|jgi:hypothetical protein|nr:hypothetical protein [Bifidobacteriaceae bacterium]